MFIIDPQILVEVSFEISDVNKISLKSQHQNITVFCEVTPNSGYFFRNNDMILLSLRAEGLKMMPEELQNICNIFLKKILSSGKTAQKNPKISIMQKFREIKKNPQGGWKFFNES